MKTLAGALCAALAGAGAMALTAQTAEPVDLAVIAKIRDEGLKRSRVQATFNQFVDVIGPRLTGSPEHKRAAEWARDELGRYGLTGVRLDPFEFGRGWTLDKFVLEMVEPRYMPLVGYPEAWSPSTKGEIAATVVSLAGKTPEEVESLQAKLQGAELSYAKLQGADLRGAQLQGADLSGAELQGADLRGAQLQGANLEGAKFEGADLGSAGIWLATFPGDLSGQSPAPLAGVDMSPLTPEAKEQLNQDLNASITDASLLAVVKSRLDDILRDEPPGWEDEARWTGLASTAKEPSAAELAQIHAKLACEDPGGSIASRMAARAIESATEPFGKAYAKDFATALLADSCEGGKALTRETRTALKDLVSAQE